MAYKHTLDPQCKVFVPFTSYKMDYSKIQDCQREHKDTVATSGTNFERMYSQDPMMEQLQFKDAEQSLVVQRLKNSVFDNVRKLVYGFPSSFFTELKKSYRVQFPSNAWLKGYELMSTFPELLTDSSQNPVVLFNCELPGSFICSFDHFLRSLKNKKMKWLANSLIEKETALKDSYGLAAARPSNWLMKKGVYDGDVSDPKKTKLFKELVDGKLKAEKKVDLCVSDGGIFYDDDSSKRDSMMMPLIAGEIMCCFSVLKDGGSMILKMFNLYSNVAISFVVELMLMFTSVKFCKPISSRPINDEIYVIGVGFKGCSAEHYSELMKSFASIKTAVDRQVQSKRSSWENAVGEIPPLLDINNPCLASYKQAVIYATKQIGEYKIANLVEFMRIASTHDNFETAKEMGKNRLGTWTSTYTMADPQVNYKIMVPKQ